jgi:hypothetical protein
MEDFLTKSLGVALGIFVLAYTVHLGLRLHDSYVTSQQVTGGSAS